MQAQPLSIRQQQTMAANRAAFDDAAQPLAWISPAAAVAAQSRRNHLIEAIGPALAWDFKGTKPHVGPLSPGCRICGEGGWSCLFVNGQCNGHCFYCPCEQRDIGVPTTQRVPFPQPAEYVDYVARFGYRGVSISGGEPLLTPQRTIDFLRAVHQAPRRPRHLWMYTNGTLLTPDLVRRLKDAGLDEIRFDISAADYDLTAVRLAAGHFPVITVEIPAIPEDADRLQALLPRIRDAGVNHLNLHQLRLTAYNRRRLAKRRYTYLHGDHVTVLESELTALALMRHVAAAAIDLPINYCASAFKHRFQGAAARRTSAQMMVRPHESVTEKGYIRTVWQLGSPNQLAAQAGRLQQAGVDPRRWTLGGRGDRLIFHPELWDRLETDLLPVVVAYHEAALQPHISYRRTFKTVTVGTDRRLFIERQPAGGDVVLDGPGRRRFETLVVRADGSLHAAQATDDGGFESCECIETGLQAYF